MAEAVEEDKFSARVVEDLWVKLILSNCWDKGDAEPVAPDSIAVLKGFCRMFGNDRGELEGDKSNLGGVVGDGGVEDTFNLRN